MSLVGTRPILQDELQKYELHHRARIAIKPGITGMWQVSGRSDITDFEEVVRLDTEYISNWNFGLDIKILFKTVMTVLKREGYDCNRLRQPYQERCVCKSRSRGVCSKWCQCQYLACPDAGTDRIFCDSLSAYFCRCHGDSFPQSRQIQWLQGLWC